MPYCAVIRTERSFTDGRRLRHDSEDMILDICRVDDVKQAVLMMCDFFFLSIGAHNSLKVIKDARTFYFVSFIALSFPVTRDRV